ncbi:unnamed protein product [Cercospora beticola]|nr:unnamed protein product [Cercospora beticola]
MPPITNVERVYQERYAEAHAYLKATNSENPFMVIRAENKFIELLEEPHIPFWMRAQCNAILAGLTDETADARKYLKGAHTSLGYFVQIRELATGSLSDTAGHRLAQLREQLTKIERDIAAREAAKEQRSAQNLEDDKEMLLGTEKEVL